MTTVVISQPLLFPWAGFFELMSMADVYVHLDDVQIADKSFTNRIQIKNSSGPVWMTIPIRGRGTRPKIMDIEAPDQSWRLPHRELVRHSLTGAPFLDDALALFDRAYRLPALIDLLAESIEGPAHYLKLGPPGTTVRSSAMTIASTKSQRILDIVLAVGGTRYVTAHGAANYLDHEAFERAGVSVEYADYSRTPYRQLHGAFTPYVSIIDTVANLGTSAGTALHPKSVPWREFLGSLPNLKRDQR